MRDFETKKDNDTTTAGQVVAAEYNSAFQELKNAVSPFETLVDNSYNQLSKVIDMASKGFVYEDISNRANSIVLSRSKGEKETFVDGMAVIFKPGNTNTGITTIKVGGLATKHLRDNGNALKPGELEEGSYYLARYHKERDEFDVERLSYPLGWSVLNTKKIKAFDRGYQIIINTENYMKWVEVGSYAVNNAGLQVILLNVKNENPALYSGWGQAEVKLTFPNFTNIPEGFDTSLTDGETSLDFNNPNGVAIERNGNQVITASGLVIINALKSEISSNLKIKIHARTNVYGSDGVKFKTDIKCYRFEH